MTIRRAGGRDGAFSLIELLCVLAIIGVLAALLLPALSQARARAKRVQCVNHLRQTGIAFQNFAQDHNGQFPMAVPVSAGGTLEFARSAYGIVGEFYFSFRHFQVLSNELVTPKMVVCPADTRQPVANFNLLGNQAISYFVGISAVPASPDSILAGDRNLTNDWARPATLLHFGPNNALRWTAELHRFKGNLLFADGRVEERNSPALAGSGRQGLVVTDLALPTLPNIDPVVPAIQGLGAHGSSAPASPVVPQALPLAVPQNQPENTPGEQPAKTNPENDIRPGWRPGFSSTPSQPDSPLAAANLQPGIRSTVFVTNSVANSPTPDPGFSLFPPLLGQGGMMHSSAGHWLLLFLILFLILGLVAVLTRRLVNSQLLRKAYHEILHLL